MNHTDAATIKHCHFCVTKSTVADDETLRHPRTHPSTTTPTSDSLSTNTPDQSHLDQQHKASIAHENTTTMNVNRPLVRDRVVYHDELCYVIHDHRPAARLHLLIIPHQHIRDCLTLDEKHQTLVERMHVIAERMLVEFGQPGEKSRVGFHVPPYISVPHLHLHVLSGGFGGCCQRQCEGTRCCHPSNCCPPFDCLRWKYWSSSWCCCQWYTPLEQVKQRIGLPPSPPERQQMKDVPAVLN